MSPIKIRSQICYDLLILDLSLVFVDACASKVIPDDMYEVNNYQIETQNTADGNGEKLSWHR